MFNEKPANPSSLSGRLRRTLPGVNDAPYNTSYKLDGSGKTMVCPYYGRWQSMMLRAYGPNYQEFEVCSEWHSFMAFRKWMEFTQHANLHMVPIDRNLPHGPHNVTFVSKQVKAMLAERVRPVQGVYMRPEGNYECKIQKNGKSQWIGSFEDFDTAHIQFKMAKVKHIYEVARTENAVVSGMLYGLASEV